MVEETQPSGSVAAVAIVLLVLVGLFVFFFVWRSTPKEMGPSAIDVEIHGPVEPAPSAPATP